MIRLKNRFPRIFLIENHHEAYYLWKERHYSHLPLIHIDAHSDLGKGVYNETEIGSGNYLYFAMQMGIADSVFWVVPGRKKEFNESLFFIKQILARFGHKQNYTDGSITLEKEIVKTKFLNKDLTICTLDALPHFKSSVLLDIDIDFLIIPSLTKAANTQEIARRIPWIKPSKFAQILKRKIFHSRCITIAYSVTDGWTPMIYRMMGDEIARLFGYCDTEIPVKLIAGKLFQKFRNHFDENNVNQARKYYFQSIRLNPKYYSFDSTYGPLYLKSGNYIQAETEFKKILTIDKRNRHALLGMALVNLLRGELKKSRKMFIKLSEQKPFVEDEENTFYLAFIEFKLGNLDKAKKLLLKCLKNNFLPSFCQYLLGQIEEKRGSLDSEKYYQALISNDDWQKLPKWLDCLPEGLRSW